MNNKKKNTRPVSVSEGRAPQQEDDYKSAGNSTRGEAGEGRNDEKEILSQNNKRQLDESIGDEDKKLKKIPKAKLVDRYSTSRSTFEGSALPENGDDAADSESQELGTGSSTNKRSASDPGQGRKKIQEKSK